MNPTVTTGLVVAGLLVLLVLPLVVGILVDRYRFRRLPPAVQVLARHLDGHCNPTHCPHCSPHHTGGHRPERTLP